LIPTAQKEERVRERSGRCLDVANKMSAKNRKGMYWKRDFFLSSYLAPTPLNLHIGRDDTVPTAQKEERIRER
jgi:hypothetical protein